MAGKARRVIDFTWWVQAGGYRWQELDSSEGQKILVRNQADEVREYKPLQENTGLFMSFAKLDPTEDAILSFANQYGSLYEDMACYGRPGQEHFMAWRAEIWDLSSAVELWLLVRRGDIAKLADRIKWGEEEDGDPRTGDLRMEPFVAYMPPPPNPRKTQIASSRLNSHLMKRFPTGNLLLPAMQHVRWLVNRRLKLHVSPKLNDDASGNDPAKDFILQLEPKNLSGAIWLQFTQAVIGGREFLECAGCHNWFEVPRGRFRKDKTVCSPRCRARVYRMRADEANKMRSKGKTLPEIAEAIGVPQKQVNKWLSISKRGEGKTHAKKTTRKR
jgi:hypothetical protein